MSAGQATGVACRVVRLPPLFSRLGRAGRFRLSPVRAEQPVQACCCLGEDLRGLAAQLVVARAGYRCQRVAQLVRRADPLGALGAAAAPGVTPGVRGAAAGTVVTVVVMRVPPEAAARAGSWPAGLV
jgi:hypothetical protein